MQLETSKIAKYSNRSNDLPSRLTVTDKGLLQQFRWNQAAKDWDRLWSLPEEVCDEFNECGSNAYYNLITNPICNCFEGFKPKNPAKWNEKDRRGGYVRNTRLNCKTDGFLKLSMLKLPRSSSTISIKGMGFDPCQDYCLKGCKCQAFAVTSRSDNFEEVKFVLCSKLSSVTFFPKLMWDNLCISMHHFLWRRSAFIFYNIHVLFEIDVVFITIAQIIEEIMS